MTMLSGHHRQIFKSNYARKNYKILLTQFLNPSLEKFYSRAQLLQLRRTREVTNFGNKPADKMDKKYNEKLGIFRNTP